MVEPRPADHDRQARGRRRLLVGAGATAALAGAGVAWWQGEPLGSRAGADPAAALWQEPFATPDGGTLLLQAWRGRTVLLNFWATWCPPCVRELPLLDAFAREQTPHGWQVVALAVDEAPAVRRFLERNPLGIAVALAGGPGLAWSRALGNDGGGLPFTVVFGTDGRIRHRKVGETTAEDLNSWLQAG